MENQSAQETPAGSQEQSANVADDIQKTVDKALENDPQRKLANQVAQDLAEAGVGDPAEGIKPAEQVQDAEYLETKNRINKALKDRSKAFKERETFRAEAEGIRQEAMRMRAEAEAYSHQVRSQVQQLQQWNQLLRSNPAQALRQAGLDPEAFIMDLAKDGTPEGAMQRRLMEQDAKLREFEHWKQMQAQQVEQQRRAAEEHYQRQFRSGVETNFIKLASNDQYKNLKTALDHGILSKSALVLEGDTIADRYREATGQEATLEEIAEYLDSQVGSAIQKLSGKQALPGSSGKPARAQQAPTKPLGQSLSQSEASERRALSKDSTNADSEERRANAIEAVKAVLAKSKKDQ